MVKTKYPQIRVDLETYNKLSSLSSSLNLTFPKLISFLLSEYERLKQENQQLKQRILQLEKRLQAQKQIRTINVTDSDVLRASWYILKLVLSVGQWRAYYEKRSKLELQLRLKERLEEVETRLNIDKQWVIALQRAIQYFEQNPQSKEAKVLLNEALETVIFNIIKKEVLKEGR